MRFITKDEVKTPLSFIFKILPWLVASLIVILYAPISDDLKWKVICVVLSIILILVISVLIFAWFRPIHLVYGESGHRAERKMEFGTETNVITHEELGRLPAISDPKKPSIEKK
jgi:hypothetical protein